MEEKESVMMLYALKVGDDILVDTISRSVYSCLCGACVFEDPDGMLDDDELNDFGNQELLKRGYSLIPVEVKELPQKKVDI